MEVCTPSKSGFLDDLIFPNEITNSYGVVTDTVSFLPFVGIWDVEKYNGVNRVIGADGEY